jgi:hypothetical protein
MNLDTLQGLIWQQYLMLQMERYWHLIVLNNVMHIDM